MLPRWGTSLFVIFVQGGGGGTLSYRLFKTSPVGGPVAFRTPRAAPATPAASPHSRSPSRSSAPRRSPHDRGTAREPRPPEERPQPKEPRRAVRVQTASVGCRAPPVPPPSC
ncbi:hypothetical protein NDU88_002726 [Pleurodeles waltl]|uniref:Uncharacterized protein n=1 Tax=Pleurodeles waltl TaxID=8319 RepID=A0AAV7UWG5_PLEWA|nr:hypothetical protein NDU88_002726 [Pleurodeles waltl]